MHWVVIRRLCSLSLLETMSEGNSRYTPQRRSKHVCSTLPLLRASDLVSTNVFQDYVTARDYTRGVSFHVDTCGTAVLVAPVPRRTSNALS